MDLDKIMEWATPIGLNIIAAVIILIVGYWVSHVVKKILIKILRKRNVEGVIVSFVGSLAYIALMAFVVIAAISKLGYQTTSFVAVIGAAGLAIGLALQGSLSNFASGFLLIIFRPFKEGDYIEGAGTAGIVEEIRIFTTSLATPDNKKVIIPNSKLTGDNIVNYTAKGTRRLQLIVGVSYNADLDKTRSALQAVLDREDRILKDPETTIAITELAESSVNFVVRAWVNSADYWNVHFNLTEGIKKQLDSQGISIPFPQRDIHIYEHKSE
ncbi:MAG: mechanosensitive ion channel [Sedimentisphaerales bacterium]|nr:mechanosensitive ion channel [Sedimentisphaerales bacterium]